MGKKVTLKEYFDSCKKENKLALKADSAAYMAAQRLKMTDDMFDVAWYLFKDYYLNHPTGMEKTYINWQQHFYSCIYYQYKQFKVWFREQNGTIKWSQIGLAGKAMMEDEQQ